jgi:hypothetical protein
MQRVIMLSVSFAAMSFAASAVADDTPVLQGKYAFTGSASCIVGADGFSRIFTTSTVHAFTSFAVEGIRTFIPTGPGTGIGTVTGRTMGVEFFPATDSGSASADTFHFSFTYTVNANGVWTSDVSAPGVSGTITAGPRTGQTFTITNFPTVTGFLSTNAEDLTVATLTPKVETITYHTATGDESVNRICERSRVFVRRTGLNDDNENDQ